MDSDLKDFFMDAFDIENDVKYHFKTIYGFTFVLKSEITAIKNNMASAEMRPLAIIYKENDEYLLAPVDEAIEIDEIIKEYVNHLF